MDIGYDVRVGFPPCKECGERYQACHDHCDRYKEWKHKQNEIKQLDHDYRLQEQELDSYELGRGKSRYKNRGQGGRLL